MQIHRLPVLNDNYIFLLADPATHTAAVVDPAQAGPVLEKLASLGLKLLAIFNTHHHADHVGGNRELLDAFPEAEVYGSRQDQGRIPGQTVALDAGDTVHFADEQATVFFVPGHTRGHIAYYFHTSGNLFCGDTLFAGGCGRLFEGTPTQMQASLAQLRTLPDETRVWCAHEYTLNNLRFALSVEADNPSLQERFQAVQRQRARHEPTIPSTMAVERATNPFMRWDSHTLQAVAGSCDPVRVIAEIRALKDRF